MEGEPGKAAAGRADRYDKPAHAGRSDSRRRHEDFHSEESDAVHRALSAVMQNQGSIGLHAPDGPPRGSWTTLRFSDGERTSIFKDVVDGELKTIYDYVATQIGP